MKTARVFKCCRENGLDLSASVHKSYRCFQVDVDADDGDLFFGVFAFYFFSFLNLLLKFQGLLVLAN